MPERSMDRDFWDGWLSRLALAEQALWETALGLKEVPGMRPWAHRLFGQVRSCRKLGLQLERRGSGRRYLEMVRHAPMTKESPS